MYNINLELHYVLYCNFFYSNVWHKWCEVGALQLVQEALNLYECEIHQNGKIFDNALHKLRIKDYEEQIMLMATMVRDTKFMNCMINRCDTCPGRQAFCDHLISLAIISQMIDDDLITSKQWDNSDYGSLLEMKVLTPL